MKEMPQQVSALSNGLSSILSLSCGSGANGSGSSLSRFTWANRIVEGTCGKLPVHPGGKLPCGDVDPPSWYWHLKVSLDLPLDTTHPWDRLKTCNPFRRSVPNTSILGLQIENCRWRIFPNLILASGMCKSICNTISWCRSRSACQHNSSNTHRGATAMHQIIFHLVEGLMGAHWSFTWRMNIYPWRLPSRLHVMKSKMDPIPSSTNLLNPLLNFGKINQVNQVYPLVSFHNNHVCLFCFPRYQTLWHLGKSP